MKHLQVACAIIEAKGKVLCTQRSESMSLPLKWEFPGGKLDEGESPGECLRRELREELGIEASVGQACPETTHHYPEFSITLYPFICAIVSGEITLHEHAAMVWLPVEKLQALDWAEADWPVIKDYQAQFKRNNP
ncbi:MAG: (deoxy)nucleoside triphosphate pyrophosphohydrolase [Nitrospirae bacterium]|nr:MAG: (deoxy)nucleoside triphosphate pyrophosphohydrolase [Nitrospirota bacterium]